MSMGLTTDWVMWKTVYEEEEIGEGTDDKLFDL